MRKLLLAALLALLPHEASAQSQTMPPPAGMIVALCASNVASPTPIAGLPYILQCDNTGALKVNASVTASIAGFAPAATFATITTGAASVSTALPAGAVVLFQNTGTTAVSCTLGVGAATATANQNIVQPGSWLALTVGANTFGACIPTSGSTANLVVLSGGSGLPTGSGGGGGAGGGGAVFSSTAPVSTMNSASANAGLNSAIAGNFDDATTTLCTENNFCFLRMSTNRNLYGTIRDAAGNERGANVDASGNLSVAVNNTPTVSGTVTANQGGTWTVQPGNTANTTPWLATINQGGNSATVSAAGALSHNTTQLGGNTINLGTGATSTGTQRVVTASDSPEIAILNTISTNTASSIPPAPAGSGNVLTGNSCGSAADNCVLKASAGNLYGVYAECTSACWLMVFNATAKPANGATTAGNASGNLVECIDVAANSSRSLTYPVFPRAFTVGIVAVVSSTACATLTASAVGFISGTVM